MSYVLRCTAAVIGILFITGDAEAVIKGRSAGAISRHVVKLVGTNLLCTATVIGRQEVLTANHCVDGGHGPYFVVAGGKRIAVTGHDRAGGASRLTLASPLPAGFIPIATNSDTPSNGSYTIAGYGTNDEMARPRSAGLREARLVADNTYSASSLVDPGRRGPIAASACMGDSGGPVARFDGRRYVLVGIVDRASNITGNRACGYLTHYASVSGVDTTAFTAPNATPVEAAVTSRRIKRSAKVKVQRRWAAR